MPNTEIHISTTYFLDEGTVGRGGLPARSIPTWQECLSIAGNTRVAISADTAKELIDAAVQHAVAVHGHTDRPELRE